MKTLWLISFLCQMIFSLKRVLCFPTDTIRRAIENKRLLITAKYSNYSIVYNWFPFLSSSSPMDSKKEINTSQQKQQKQLELSILSFHNSFPEIPIHLFTNSSQNFSSEFILIHHMEDTLPSSPSLHMIHSLLYG